MFNPFQKVPSVSVAEAFEKTKNPDVAFIDVRSSAEYDAGHAEGAVNIPLQTISSSIDSLKGHHEVYVICQSGGRSAGATSILVGAGVNAINVSGGTSAWRTSGLPLG